MRALAGRIVQLQALQGATLVVGFVASVIVARGLGPEQKGVVDAFLLLVMFASEVAMVGFQAGSFYELSRRTAEVEVVNGNALLFAAVQGLVVSLAAWLGFDALRAAFPNLSGWMIVLACALLPVGLYQLIWPNILMAAGKVVSSYRIHLSGAIGRVLLLGGLWGSGWLNAGTGVMALAALILFEAIAGYVWVRRGSNRPRVGWQSAEAVLRYGFVIYVGGLANLLHFKIDQLMINYWLGSAPLANYNIAVRLAELLFVLDAAVMAGSLPAIAGGERATARSLASRLAMLQVALSGLVGALAVIAAPWVIPKVYGEAYIDSVSAFQWLVPGIVAWSASKFLSVWVSYNVGKAALIARAAVAGMLLNVVLNLLVLVALDGGIDAVAAVSSLSYAAVGLAVALIARGLRGRATYGFRGKPNAP